MSQLEQRTNIKFCQKLGKTTTDIVQRMQQDYGDDALRCVLCLGDTDVFHKGDTVWRVICVLDGHKLFELNTRLKT